MTHSVQEDLLKHMNMTTRVNILWVLYSYIKLIFTFAIVMAERQNRQSNGSLKVIPMAVT